MPGSAVTIGHEERYGHVECAAQVQPLQSLHLVQHRADYLAAAAKRSPNRPIAEPAASGFLAVP